MNNSNIIFFGCLIEFFIIFLMSKAIRVGPLPSGVTKQQVEDALKVLNIGRIVLKGDIALAELLDSNADSWLNSKFEEMKFEGLGEAKIDPNLDDFDSFSNSAGRDTEEVKSFSKQSFTENRKFLTVKGCDSEILKKCDQDYIKKIIFKDQKIRNAFQFEKEIYLQFDEPVELKILQKNFEDSYKTELGPSTIFNQISSEFFLEKMKKQLKIMGQEKKLQTKQEKKIEQDEQDGEMNEREEETFNKETGLFESKINFSFSTKAFWAGVVTLWAIHILLA